MKSLFFISILFLSFFCYAESSNTVNLSEPDSELNTILKKLQKNSVLRSQFKQSRHLKILSRPIISEGQLNYFSGTGIIWDIRKPIQSKIIISQNKITEIDANHKITRRPNPGGIYTLLDALFNGNSQILKQNFDIKHDLSTENWRLELTPKSSPLNKAFKTIEIQGQQQIKRITLNDINSDSTVITLSSTNTEQMMTTKEASYFAL